LFSDYPPIRLSNLGPDAIEIASGPVDADAQAASLIAAR
jgi:hypothetical protein